MVSTLMLKDTSDRTAFKVFEPGGTAEPAGLRLRQQPDAAARPGELRASCPGRPGTGWLRAQPWFQDGTPVELDTRRVLQRALARLARRRAIA